jgi:hypothetical protein
MGTVGNTRRLRSLSLLALSIAVGIGHANPQEERRSTVADLRYGATLYEYFQGNHFQALSELMVAEAMGGIRGHRNHPELIRGGIALSFGMQEQASEIFSALLVADQNGNYEQPTDVRNAAWFHLARLQYLRGDWTTSAESLDRVAGEFDRSLLPELESTAINLAIRRNDLQSAESQLAAVRYAQDQRHYLYFNLANAYSRQQDFGKANHLYERLAALPVSQLPTLREEQLALRDRGLTSAGYARLLQGEHQLAIDQFLQVRLDSPWSQRALLGYGWAAAELGDYRLALTPWQTLSQGSLTDPSVQEARLALPYAYENLEAKGQALNAYLDAESAFEAEIARIDDLIASADQLDLLAALNISDRENTDWFQLDHQASTEPHVSYLAELYALNHFQGAVQELRDLLQLNERLRDWRNKLEIYRDMLQQREQVRELKLAEIQGLQLQDRLQSMTRQRDALDRELKRIESEKDYFSLASEDEKELVDIVRSAEQAIDLLRKEGEPTEEYEAALKRYRGLLFWQASQDFPERSWQVRSGIRQLDGAIAAARENLARLEQVIADAPDITPYRLRIAALGQRLDAQDDAMKATLGLVENNLRSMVTEELIAQRQRLQHYLAQARLSVARLYDQAAQEPGT